MNIRTRQLITAHGVRLLLAFPDALERDAFVLAKKLRRIETSLDDVRARLIHGDSSMDEAERLSTLAKDRTEALLGTVPALALNLSPNGYALLLSASWTAAHNAPLMDEDRLPTTAAGNGILAPFITSLQ